MPPTESVASYRTAAQKIVFVLLILGAVVSIPYLFPAPLSISRSYVAGFSNRVAVILLFLGTGLFAVFTRARISRTDIKDATLGWKVLLFALLFTFADCLQHCRISPIVLPGPESEYFLNRFQMLASGSVPYRQFEFVYGPLLLYPILWVQKLLHLSTVQAYVVTWLLFWQVGVIMVWVVVRGLDFPLPFRKVVFGFLVLTQLAWGGYGGLSYTPLRAYFSAFCIVVTYQVWKRFRSAWLVAFCSVALIALTICCSMDQAVAVIVGLFAFMFLLVLSPKKEFSRTVFAVSAFGAIACLGCAGRIGLLEPLRSFGGGGYSYPLLPSPAIFLVLFAYIVAGCVLYRAFRGRFFKAARNDITTLDSSLGESIVLPLMIAGCAMIPAALGRCDVLHITAATPAFVVGVAAICAMPTIRRWWLPLAVVFLIIVPPRINRILPYLKIRPAIVSDPALLAQGFTTPISDNQWYVSPSGLTASELPCDRQYFSPSFMPLPTEKFLPACLDTGYYLGFTDVITPRAIENKVSELRKHASEPLLMENSPLEAQLPRQLATMESLYSESETLWVPPVRHAPLTFAPIIDYIRHHYVKGPEAAQGRLRIWYPAQVVEQESSNP